MALAKLTSILVTSLAMTAAARTPPQSCSDNTTHGYFHVYNTNIGKIDGCLDVNGKWTIDGDCSVFGAQSQPKIFTTGPGSGWCQFNYSDGTDISMPLACGSAVSFDNGSYFSCFAGNKENDLEPSSFHYTWSWNVAILPGKGKPVTVFWTLEDQYDPQPPNTTNVQLRWEFTAKKTS